MDLKDERSKVMQALLGIEMFPAGMELFPASDETQWELIKRVIDDSDYYIVIIGARYGSLDSDGLSYTEKEYRYAVDTGTPVFGFVLSDPGQAIVADTDRDPDLAERLETFRSLVKSKMCQFYSNPDELALKVITSLTSARTQFPTDGWVRGSDATSSESREQLLATREELQEVKEQLKKREVFEVDADLLQGEDEFDVSYQRTSVFTESAATSFDVTMTWNQIFKLLGPTMLDEASERDLRSRLRSEATGSVAESMYRVAVSDSAFDQIKMQLVALGLIARSDRKRSVKDTLTYWQLTETGRTKLMSLGALRRSDAGD